MAKENGLGFSCIIDESDTNARTISSDITNLSISTPRAMQDITGLDKSAMERLGLLIDSQVTVNGVFNDASNMSHEVFKDCFSSAVQRTVTLAISGQTLTAGEMLFTDYNLTRAADGSLTFSSPGLLANGTAPSWS